MKNKLMEVFDKLMLRKRAIIETIYDQLKNILKVEHTRHRSGLNFWVTRQVPTVTSLPKMRTFLCGNGCENTSEKRLSSGDFRRESRLRYTIALSALLVLVH